jgi:hypothetical protein
VFDPHRPTPKVQDPPAVPQTLCGLPVGEDEMNRQAPTPLALRPQGRSPATGILPVPAHASYVPERTGFSEVKRFQLRVAWRRELCSEVVDRQLEGSWVEGMRKAAYPPV